MKHFNIRLATLEDRNDIFRVHCDSVCNLCTGEYTQEQVDMWLDGRNPDIYLRAIQRNELWVAIVGSILLGFVEVENHEITKLFVSGTAAGAGVGEALLNTAIGHIRKLGQAKIYLESTLTARGFYRRFGFSEIGIGTFTRGGATVSLEIIKMELSWS